MAKLGNRIVALLLFIALIAVWYGTDVKQTDVVSETLTQNLRKEDVVTKQPTFSVKTEKPVKTTVSVPKHKQNRNFWCDKCYKWKVPVLKDPKDGFCTERNGSSVELLIIAVSRHQNRMHRNILRKIYSHDPDYGDRIRLLFAFGLEGSGNTTEDELLLKEHEMHGDVIIFDIKVTYYGMQNLNFNTFNWATQKCRNTRFLVKITDDVFLNIPGWLKTFEKFGSTQLFDVHFGTCNYGTDHPIRDPKHKWSVSVEDYPFKNYPGYCAGGGLFLSLETTKEILKELSNLAMVFPFDDLDIGLSILLTGHCVCNIPGTFISYEIDRDPRIRNTFARHEPKQCGDININPFLGLHMQGLSPQRMLNLWKLKHCLSDRYPRVLRCPRRYTCKQKAYPVIRTP